MLFKSIGAVPEMNWVYNKCSEKNTESSHERPITAH